MSVQLYIYREREGESAREERGLPPAGSLPKWLHLPGLSRVKARSQELHWASHTGAGAQALRPSSTAFPRPSAGSWIGSGAARTQTGTHMDASDAGSGPTCSTTALAPNSAVLIPKSWSPSTPDPLNCRLRISHHSQWSYISCYLPTPNSSSQVCNQVSHVPIQSYNHPLSQVSPSCHFTDEETEAQC